MKYVHEVRSFIIWQPLLSIGVNFNSLERVPVLVVLAAGGRRGGGRGSTLYVITDRVRYV